MLVKKEVIRKRLEAQLGRIAKKREDHVARFPSFKEEAIQELEHRLELVRGATNWSSYYMAAVSNAPYAASLDEFTLRHREQQIKRSLAMLEAIEGDSIEITALKTSRGVTFESMFDEE